MGQEDVILGSGDPKEDDSNEDNAQSNVEIFNISMSSTIDLASTVVDAQSLDVIQDLSEHMDELEDENSKGRGENPDILQEISSLEGEIAMRLAKIEPASEIETITEHEGVGEELSSNDAIYSNLIHIEDDNSDDEVAGQPDEMAGIAEKLSEVEPAAGGTRSVASSETSADGGYGYQSSFDAQGVISIDDVGPIDPTKLEYGIEFKQEDVFIDDDESEISPDTPANDVPEIMDATNIIDESDLSPDASISGRLVADFGQDGGGGFSASGDMPTQPLISNGKQVTVSFDAATNTYTGTAAGEDIFTLSIAQNATYEFVLLGTLDHPDGADPNDALNLQFGIRATDFDGDFVDGYLTISVLDDAPFANDDYVTFDISENSIDGNIIDNDDLSEDHSNMVTKISFDGNMSDVPETGAVSIDGDFGVLVIEAGGSYTYTLFDDARAGRSSPSSCNDSQDISDAFEYILTDGDGDVSTAILKFDGLSPKLIVGENINDTGVSGEQHHIGGEEGAIIGGGAPDILIGDFGGATLEQQTQDYNFVFIVDVSGSMGSANNASSRISLLKDAVEKLLNDFGDYSGGEIKVHITPFATDVKASGTFSVTDIDGLTSALGYLETLTGSGYTNFESPLQEANLWLQGGDPIGGDAITTTYFISDGNPNKYVDDQGNIKYSNANTVMAEITGADGSDEVAMLHSLNDDVIAVGINASSSVISRLNVIDIDGDALNIDEASDLNIIFNDTSPLNNVAAVGNDVIEGGGGDDIIFGDSVNTDILADNYDIDSNDGAGFEVFDKLETGESSIDNDWSRDDTIDYIKNNLDELATESINSGGASRVGGDDIIHGGDGDDVIYAQEGDDVLYGGAGSDILSGGSGGDQFMLDVIGQGIDVVCDFSVNEGDVLDFAGLIQNYDPTQQAIDDFIFTRELNGGTVLSIDVKGSGDASQAVDLVALEGMQNIDIQTMFEDGNINVF